MQKIVIIGTGGFGREVADLILDSDEYQTIGFLDNDKEKHNTIINGYNVLGDDDWLLDNKGMNVAIGIGNPKIKKSIIDKIRHLVHFPTFIHSTVQIGSRSNIGMGCIITAGNIITCNIEIKNHVTINLSCTIGHDTVIDDYTTISPGANISGYVTLGKGVYIGTNAAILEKVSVGDWSTIGGGALVNKHVMSNVIVKGVPAK